MHGVTGFAESAALLVCAAFCVVGIDHSIEATTEAKGRRDIRSVHAWRYGQEMCVIGGLLSVSVLGFILLSPDRRKKAFPPSDGPKTEPNQTPHPTTL